MYDELRKKIDTKQAKICIIGLGYVGLPLVIQFGKSGFQTLGYDIDPKKVDANNRGESYIRHIPGEEIKKLRDSGVYEATADPARLSEPDAVLICVPTPLNRNREPNLEYVEKTTETISSHIRRGQLISLESTTYPGTTEEVVKPILDKTGGVVGEDYFLVYSPEREDPGNPDFNTRTIPKVVGGVTDQCLELGHLLYSKIIDRIVPVSSPKSAELTKLLENIYRSVNIALVNELKILTDKMHINIWEVIDAAATKPFGFHPFYPGPGLGGHCIPIDPFYLSWKAREYGVPTRFIELSGEINGAMPDYVVSQAFEKLNNARKSINGARILILGIAYKKDVDDLRESPALVIMEKLQNLGAEIFYHDPYIDSIPELREFSFDMSSVPLTPENLSSSDLVIVVTDHTEVDYEKVSQFAPLILDTRNAVPIKGHHV